jgi:thioredoxin-related protein
MAYFWKKGCNACEYMRDRVFNKEEVSSFINDNFIPYKTNIIPDDYSIFAYPTIYFIDHNGEILAEPVMGARNLDEFMFMIEDVIKDNTEKSSK